MTRADFQRLSRQRVADAKALMRARRYAAAYYLCGYAVECAIKACIAKQTRRFDFPVKETREIYTRNLTALLKSAGLTAALKADMEANPALRANWVIVKDWNEESRYEAGGSRQESLALLMAVTEPQNGILGWLQQRW